MIKIRKVKGKDIFKISKILKKMNLDFSKYDFKGKDNFKMGIQLIKDIFENIHLAENEFNEFLADLSGIKKEEISELGLKEYKELLFQLKEDDDIIGFFGQQA
jgi:hypothetical protein